MDEHRDREEAVLLGRAPADVNRNPLQRAGVDTVLQRSTFGGPGTGMDIRFVVSRHLLEPLLVLAQASPTRRAVIHAVEVDVVTLRDKGHTYQIMTLRGERPVLEGHFLVGVETERSLERFREREVNLPPRAVVMRRDTLGGVGCRMYLPLDAISQALERARASLTGRALFQEAGVKTAIYQNPDGVMYRVLTMIGRPPIPEKETEHVR